MRGALGGEGDGAGQVPWPSLDAVGSSKGGAHSSRVPHCRERARTLSSPPTAVRCCRREGIVNVGEVSL